MIINNNRRQVPGLNKIQDVTSNEVLDTWAENEEHDPGWINTATTIKGWDSWRSWRGHTMSLLRAHERSWARYRILNPLEFFSQMLVGPYSSWQEPLLRKNAQTFQQALEINTFYTKFHNNPKILSLIEDFPIETTIIGVFREDLGTVACIEGHHRVTAVVLAEYFQTPIDFSRRKAFINLFVLSTHENDLFDTILTRGTSKISPL